MLRKAKLNSRLGRDTAHPIGASKLTAHSSQLTAHSSQLTAHILTAQGKASTPEGQSHIHSYSPQSFKLLGATKFCLMILFVFGTYIGNGQTSVFAATHACVTGQGPTTGTLTFQFELLAPGPFTYTISNGTPYVGGAFSNLPAGTYTITTWNSSNVPVATWNWTINAIPLVVAPTITVLPTCQNNTATVCANASGGNGGALSYVWYGSGGVVSTVACPSGLAPGTYTVLVQEAGCSCSANASITIVNPTITLDHTLTHSDCASNCNGAIDLTPNGTAPYTYSWNGPGVVNVATEDLANLCAGNYTVNVTDANGCTGTGTYTIMLNGADVLATNLQGEHIIATNTLWNPAAFGNQTQIIVDATVIVNPGVTLTIVDLDVRFTPQHSLRALNSTGTAQPAHIVGNNSIFDVICGDTWRGFEILGNGVSTAQGNRATLILSNNCYVRHAECGVRNHTTVYPSTASISNSGGQINCSNTNFIDNVFDLELVNYFALVPSAANYSAIFTNSLFQLNNLPLSWETTGNAAIILASTTWGRITLGNTADVRFTDCTLENTNANYSNTLHTHGLVAAVSNFRWTGFDFGDTFLPASYTSHIRGWRNAMRITGLGPIATNTMLSALITHTHFQNHRNITTLNGPSITIANNRIENFATPAFSHTSLATGNSIDNQWHGVYLNNTATFATNPQQFFIAHNFIDDPQNNAVASYGINLQNTGIFDNFIIENEISNCKNALFFNLVNRNGTSVNNGTHYECNIFTTNVQDVYIQSTNNSGAANLGVATPQTNSYFALFPAVPSTLSAGNNFVASTLGNAKNDINTTGIGSLPLHNYWYNALDQNVLQGPSFMTTVVHAPNQKPHNDCGYPWRAQVPMIIGGGGNNETMTSLRQNIAEKQLQLDALIDEGNTNQLLAEVNNVEYQNALALYNKLMEQSPALSDEVMLAAIQQEYDLPKALLAQVLAANPQAAKSAEIQTALDERINPLDAYQRGIINNGRNWFSEKEMLELSISANNAAIAKEMHTMLACQVATGSMLNLLDESTYSEAILKAHLLAYTGNTNAAQSLFATASNTHGSSIQASSLNTWKQIMDMRNEIQNAGVTIDPATIASLELISNDNTDGMGMFAYSVLMDFSGYPELELAENATLHSTQMLGGADAVEETTLELWPVPCTAVINVRYASGFGENFTIEVLDSHGKKVVEQLLEMGQQETVVLLDELPIGLYNVTLVNAATGERIVSNNILKH